MDKKKYQMGAIWIIPDKEIKFPWNLFRQYHQSRTVVVIEQSSFNFDPNEDLILVAPLSSKILEHHSTDILLEPDELNKLDKKSYIRMRAIQFITKSSCKRYVGRLSDINKCDILSTLQFFINAGQAN